MYFRLPVTFWMFCYSTRYQCFKEGYLAFSLNVCVTSVRKLVYIFFLSLSGCVRVRMYSTHSLPVCVCVYVVTSSDRSSDSGLCNARLMPQDAVQKYQSKIALRRFPKMYERLAKIKLLDALFFAKGMAVKKMRREL